MISPFYRQGVLEASRTFMPKYAQAVTDHLLTVAMHEAGKGVVDMDPSPRKSKMIENKERDYGLGTVAAMAAAGGVAGYFAGQKSPGWAAAGAGLGGALSLPLVLGSDEVENEQVD